MSPREVAGDRLRERSELAPHEEGIVGPIEQRQLPAEDLHKRSIAGSAPADLLDEDHRGQVQRQLVEHPEQIGQRLLLLGPMAEEEPADLQVQSGAARRQVSRVRLPLPAPDPLGGLGVGTEALPSANPQEVPHRTRRGLGGAVVERRQRGLRVVARVLMQRREHQARGTLSGCCLLQARDQRGPSAGPIGEPRLMPTR